MRREKPLNNALLNGCLVTPDGAAAHGIALVHGQHFCIATRAWFALAAENGLRKDEFAKKSRRTEFVHGRLTFASVVWRIRACGGEVVHPTMAQLVLLSEADGDGFYLKHGRAKNNFFGIFFAPTPSLPSIHIFRIRCVTRRERCGS